MYLHFKYLVCCGLDFVKKCCSGRELFFLIQDKAVRATDLLAETAGRSPVPGSALDKNWNTVRGKRDEKKV